MSITWRDDVEFGVTEDNSAGLSVDLKLSFPSGMPGFPDVRSFVIEELGAELRPFCRMRSASEPIVSFTVVAPGYLFPDYKVEIDEEYLSTLSISGAEDVVTLVMVTVPRPPAPPTANLLGPIVVNKRTGVSAQVVQHQSDYGVAEPLQR